MVPCSIYYVSCVVGVMGAADFLSYMVVVHLLWPSRSYLYFNLKTETRLSLEELEFTGLMIRDTSSMISGLSGMSGSSQNSASAIELANQ